MEIELEIGAKVKINGNLCEVVKSRKCSDCEVQKATFGRKNYQGLDMQCGKKYGGNTTDLACSKESRSDKADIIFKRIL